MIIQCPECRTRFRIADERMKPDGLKIRCARCRGVFLAPHPDQKDLPSAKTQDTSAPSLHAAGTPSTQEAVSTQENRTAVEEGYSPPPALGLKDDGPSNETTQPTDDIRFPDPSPTAEDDGLADLDAPDDSPENFDSAPAADDHVEEPGSSHELSPENSLREDSLLVEDRNKEAAEEDPFTSEGNEPVPTGDVHDEDFSFDEPTEQEPGEEFTFDGTSTGSAGDDEFFFEEDSDEDLNGDFDFGHDEQEDPDEQFGFGEDDREGIDPFAFDSKDSSASDDDFQLEGNTALDSSFDSGDDDFATSEDLPDEVENDNLSFGSIDFSTIAAQSEPSPLSTVAQQENPALNDSHSDSESPLDRMPSKSPAPRAEKKRASMGGLLTIVLILLLGLVGLAGYVVWQGGPEEMVRIFDRAGVQKTPPAAAGQIRLNDLRSFFVQNGEAGQLFIISGQAINDFQEARSAIAIKGILFSPQGEALLQQTVFAGNPIVEEELRQLSFPALEEKMNNQFGESLSNLNVVPGKSIPFTIIFKELPENLAEFTVEIADSRPGSAQ